ncbi:hypothetical protein GYMLUDRAFT_41920 [Collybiopsis luxurians FD-317 M1]|uniref:Uncharacterized protein n=1 Tax=Collybiopsis luxurians FD-317 M1 TaxID=944289 RepID=A0A0D0BF99_9AGAR|nr:hypothetical protein GYMLUDRAFT_41920 [Collybiopsis luxurians FD-317 M1]
MVGSPGIGKSTCLAYQLVLRLSREQLTFYYNGLTIYFDATGAYKVHFEDNEDYEPFLGFEGTMCLMNSDFQPLPSRYWKIPEALFPVLATSSEESQYRQFAKHRELHRIIPKAPSFEEALLVCGQNNNSASIELMKYAWDTYGPEFRLVKKVTWTGKDAISEHDSALTAALQYLDYHDLIKLLGDPDSHKIVFSYSTEEQPTVLRHRIRSGPIMRLLFEASALKRLEDRQYLFNFFQLSPWLAPSLGHLFEIMSMEKLAGNFYGVLKSLEGGQDRHFHFDQLPIKFFNNNSPASDTLLPFKFYVPKNKNNKAYDGFRYDDRVGYGFQKTVSDTHELNQESILDLYKRFAAAEMLEFIFILVTPMKTNYRLPNHVYRPHSQNLPIQYFQLELDFGPEYNELFSSLTEEFYWDGMVIEN